MAEIKEFVVNDRRKFTAEGDARPDAPPSEPKPPRPEASLEPTSDEKFGSSARLVENKPAASRPTAQTTTEAVHPEEAAPPALTAEQTSQAQQAYSATVERLDTAVHAANPGMEKMPEMTFEHVIQSLYMQAIIQLGGVTEPGAKPQIDLLGARQTIDMLALIIGKTKGNLTDSEAKLVDNALFELRMGFLEVTQALARQAQQTQAKQPPPAAPTGPSIVR